MFTRKREGWFLRAFLSLLASVAIYRIARFFMKSAEKTNRIDEPVRMVRAGKAARDSLFI